MTAKIRSIYIFIVLQNNMWTLASHRDCPNPIMPESEIVKIKQLNQQITFNHQTFLYYCVRY